MKNALQIRGGGEREPSVRGDPEFRVAPLVRPGQLGRRRGQDSISGAVHKGLCGRRGTGLAEKGWILRPWCQKLLDNVQVARTHPVAAGGCLPCPAAEAVSRSGEARLAAAARLVGPDATWPGALALRAQAKGS